MSKELIEEFLQETIDAFRRDDVWDEPPTLGLLSIDADRRIWVAPFPDSVWAHGHPRRVLHLIAHSIPQIGAPPLPDGFTLVGLVLVSEGYGIDGNARPVEYWDTHHIADDPAGYEYVSAIAVDLDGNAYGNYYRRFAATSHQHAATAGALVDGLRQVMAAMRDAAEVASW